jgi:hypothetical protein
MTILAHLPVGMSIVKTSKFFSFGLDPVVRCRVYPVYQEVG